MKYKLNGFNILLFLCISAFAVLIIVNPLPCKDGAFSGILLCGRVIIPSLFPFCVAVLCILKSGVCEKLSFFSGITKKLFKMPAELFAVVLLSFTGGYPVGAKLLNELVKEERINKTQAAAMLNYCVNAGPAFIVSAVGSAILKSKSAGYILLAAHTLASFTLMIFTNAFTKAEFTLKPVKEKEISASDNFVLSTAEASASLVNICSFVILFSSINGYLRYYESKAHLIKILRYTLEITNAVSITNNIYLISFLLGFGGICVWFQIFSVANRIEIKPLKFAVFRLLHSILSAVYVKIIIKVSKFSLPVFSNISDFGQKAVYSTFALSASMLVTAIVFIISVYTKKYAGNIVKNVV